MAPHGGSSQLDLLFHNYTRFHESRLAPTSSDSAAAAAATATTTASVSEADLARDARAFLRSRESGAGATGAFSRVDVYGAIEASQRQPGAPGLAALARGLAWFEEVAIHVFLYPWKKEFRQIKAFSGPFVYWVRGVVRDVDTERILHLLGFTRCPADPRTTSTTSAAAAAAAVAYERRGRAQPDVALSVAFELFLAGAECRFLDELVSRSGSRRLPLSAVVRERLRGSWRGVDALETALAAAAAAAASDAANGDDAGPCDRAQAGLANPEPWASDAAIAAALSRRADEHEVDREEAGAGVATDDIRRPTPSLMHMSVSPVERAEPRGRPRRDRPAFVSRVPAAACGDCRATARDDEPCPSCRHPLCDRCRKVHCCPSLPVEAGARSQPQPQPQPAPAAAVARPAAGRCGFCGDAEGALSCRSCRKVTCQDCCVQYREECRGEHGRQHAFAPLGAGRGRK